MKKTGLSPVFMPSGMQSMLSFFTGAIDLAYVGETPFVLGRAYGLPVRIVGIAQQVGRSHGVVLRQGHSREMLKIGTSAGSLGHFVGTAWADQQDPDRVLFVDLSPQEQMRAFEFGFLDGIASYEPYLSVAELSGAERVFDASSMPPMFNVICATDSIIDSSPEQVKAFVHAHNRAVRTISDELSEENLDFLAAVFDDRLSSAMCRDILEMNYSWAEEDFLSNPDAAEICFDSLKRAEAFLLRCGLIHNDPLVMADCFPPRKVSPSQAAKDLLRVAYSDTLMCAPFHVAREAGYFTDDGFNIVEDTGRIVERVAQLSEVVRAELKQCQELSASDPALAVMKYGIVAERSIANAYELSIGSAPRQVSKMIEDLTDRKLMPTRVSSAAHWLRTMRNEAAHSVGTLSQRDADVAYSNTVEVLQWYEQNENVFGLHCKKCGAAVESKWVVCPRCAFPRTRTCQSCNQPAEPEWKQCPHCGSAFPPSASS